MDIYCEHGRTHGMCPLCSSRAAELLALRKALAVTRDALRDLLDDVGHCVVEHCHHCNATGSHRVDTSTCATCAAWKLIEQRWESP